MSLHTCCLCDTPTRRAAHLTRATRFPGPPQPLMCDVGGSWAAPHLLLAVHRGNRPPPRPRSNPSRSDLCPPRGPRAHPSSGCGEHVSVMTGSWLCGSPQADCDSQALANPLATPGPLYFLLRPRLPEFSERPVRLPCGRVVLEPMENVLLPLP